MGSAGTHLLKQSAMEIDKQVGQWKYFLVIKFNLLLLFVSPVLHLLKKLKQQSKELLEERRPKLIQALKQMGDFYLQLKWDFQSWGI